MRRYAKQDREDVYNSSRDYQQIAQSAGLRLVGEPTLKSVRFSSKLEPTAQEMIAGFGGFILCHASTVATLYVHAGKLKSARQFHCGPSWVRLGFGFALSVTADVLVELEFDVPQSYIDIWGFVIGFSHFPNGTISKTTILSELNVSHLLPETLYLDHRDGIVGELTGATMGAEAGSPIELKKCSYCGRQLPSGPGQAGRLSFHKHNAKVSGHQNECRACKKWRINNSFNPLRTVDQLNESSIITRERRLLLREAEILQTIKEREGRGLKSIVWERFGRRCFYCGKLLALKESELDHTRPLAYLWPIDEYATCLCPEHNNHKKDKFPVDFYSAGQLEQLSSITGLSLLELQKRAICETQLERIRSNIVAFAENCDPRAFNAIARKVGEIRSDVNLWAELYTADADLCLQMKRIAAQRPGGPIGGSAPTAVDEMLDSLEE